MNLVVLHIPETTACHKIIDWRRVVHKLWLFWKPKVLLYIRLLCHTSTYARLKPRTWMTSTPPWQCRLQLVWLRGRHQNFAWTVVLQAWEISRLHCQQWLQRHQDTLCSWICFWLRSSKTYRHSHQFLGKQKAGGTSHQPMSIKSHLHLQPRTSNASWTLPTAEIGLCLHSTELISEFNEQPL